MNLVVLRSGRHLFFLLLLGIAFSCFFGVCNVQDCAAYTILSPRSEKPIIIKMRRSLSTLVIKALSNEKYNTFNVFYYDRKGVRQNVAIEGVYRKGEAYYLHYILPLKRGENNFIVEPGMRQLTVYYNPVRTLLNSNFEDPKNYLFHRNAVVPEECGGCHTEKLPEKSGLEVRRLSKNMDFSPLCFSCHRRLHSKNEWLHGPTANLYCMSCHRKEAGNTTITTLTERVDRVCFQCHINKQKIESLSHVHGPVGTGDCTICHDPHGDRYQFQLWADGKVDLCLGCHSDKKDAARNAIGFYPHGIIQGAGCVSCHSPHATNHRFQLYKPINDLCISCHFGFSEIDEGHPVGGHPVSNRIDPRRVGRELSCTSCHIPHGSNYRYLLIGDVLGGHVCNKCHKG